MSGHFVYEIDERKLRVKLQEIEVEQKQDAWSNFESYYLSKNKTQNEGPLKNFYVPISMNIVLPLVFGLIIIIVAVILFKFISIKNPEIQTTIEEKAPIETITKTDSTSIKLNVLKEAAIKDSLEKVKSKQIARMDSIANRRLDSLKTILNQVDNQKSDKVVTTTPVIKKETEANANKQTAVTTNTNGSGQKDVVKTKKKKRKSTADSIQQEKLLEELIPVPEENEASLKPN